MKTTRPSDAAPVEATHEAIISDCIDRIWPKTHNRDVVWEDRDRLDISLICCELVSYRQGWKSHPEDAPEIPMADQDELEDIARAEAAGTEDAPGGLN